MGRKPVTDERQLILFDCLPAAPAARSKKAVRKPNVIDLTPVATMAVGHANSAVEVVAAEQNPDLKNEPTFQERATYGEFERLRRMRNRFTGWATFIGAVIVATNFNYARVTADFLRIVAFDTTTPKAMNGLFGSAAIVLCTAALLVLVLAELKLHHAGPFYAEVPYPTKGSAGRGLHYAIQLLILTLLGGVSIVTLAAVGDDMRSLIFDIWTSINWLFQEWGPRVRRI